MARIKWDIDKVRQFVEENSDCELLSTEYVNVETKMKFKCSCGEIFLTAFRSFKNQNKRHCDKCGKDNYREKRREYVYKFDEGQIIYNNNGGIRLTKQTTKKAKNGQIGTAYRFKCLNDGYEGIVLQTMMENNKVGCPVCCGKKVVPGINDIATTDKELLKYFKNQQDGFIHSRKSNKKIDMICPNCGLEKSKRIADLTDKGFGCNMCGDGISYPEKFTANALKCLDIDFVPQKTFEWSEGRRYDFYFKKGGKEYIVEVHGEQHYKERVFGSHLRQGGLEGEIMNDDFKKSKALQNGIDKYIVIDARKPNADWIKRSILDSELDNLDLNKVDWKQCAKLSAGSLLVDVCRAFDNGINNTKNLVETFGISRSTVWSYLTKGVKMGLCDYNGKQSLSTQMKARFNKELI